MHHPSHEDLSDFLYDELPAARRAEVCEHVQSCDECRARVASWQDVRGTLQSWQLPQRREISQPATRFRLIPSVAKWAVAACVFITCGFALARLTAPRAMDAAATDNLRTQLKQEVSGEIAHYVEAQVAEQRAYQRGVDRRIEKLETDRLADYSGLRKDVETVALHTQEEFVRLASSNPSVERP